MNLDSCKHIRQKKSQLLMFMGPLLVNDSIDDVSDSRWFATKERTMTVRVEEKVLAPIDVGQRTRIFLAIGVAMLAAVSVLAFLASAAAPGTASRGSAQRSIQADSARYEALAAYYAEQAQDGQGAISAYEANNTARELRIPNLAAHIEGPTATGSQTLNAPDRVCVYDNGNRVFVCRSTDQ
jgi:type II secretory pathway pseudopilin PulG